MWHRSLVTVLLVVLKPIYGSIVEINETRFSSLPPLFALDDWSECQEEGDVYCTVDAALVSRDPSPILTLLQEYSKQTLKHYNRSVVHRGLCVSRCGPQLDGSWADAAQACLNASLAKYGLQAVVESVLHCSSAGTVEGRSGSRALAALCTVLVALACLATALHALADRCGRPDCNKYLLAFSVKRNWEILTYDRSKPRTDERMKDIACIEGIRFLGMQCIIFSHVLLSYAYSYTDNPHYIEKMYDQFGWKLLLNSPVWLQAFFSLSGFLTAYSTFIHVEKRGGTGLLWGLRFFLLAVVDRWMRLTPLAVFTLWFTMSWFPQLGSGPQWWWVVAREAEDCSQRWWYHALYIHNHLPLNKFCMGHTWYLAVDMQLHVLCLLLLLIIIPYRRAAGPLLGSLVLGSAVAAGLTVYWLDLGPIITAQAPEALRTLFAHSRLVPRVYVPMWGNLPGHAAGVATAAVLYWVHSEGVVKLNQVKWFTVMFHSSLLLSGVVVASGVVFLSDAAGAGGPWRAWGALYAAFDRPLVALSFNIFLLGCFTKCTSIFLTLLNWRGFHILGRLSYCVFLTHFITIRLIIAGNTHLNHASILAFISLYVTTSFLSYVAAIPLCLLVELPAVQLWKAASGVGGHGGAGPPVYPAPPMCPPPPACPPGPPVPSHDVKPFDLLTNVRRRLDMA